MALECYMSGVEGKQHFNACVDAGVEHVLVSYLYLEKTDKDMVRQRKLKHPNLKFMIDSGAHTFQSDKAKYSSWSLTDFEDYIKRYVKWLRANKEFVESAVELDIDWNVGTNVVESWQRKYFIPMLEEGFNIIFVFHKQRGIDGWEEMCSKYSYVGLPGEWSAESDFNKWMTVAKRYTTKVHGFAATKQSDFRDWSWYSADSTTWKSSERYGTLIHWDEHNQRIVFEEDKSKRGLYRKYFEKYQLDADGIIQDKNYREVTKYALISMTAMERFYARKYKDRLFYYELRLPHPRVVSSFADSETEKWWKLMRPDTLFKEHAGERNRKRIRRYLAALAGIQYSEHSYFSSGTANGFIGAYFPKLVGVADPDLFQKELSMYLAPANPPPLERVDPVHFIATNNPPKVRSEREYGLDELEHDVTKVPLLLEDL